MGWGLLTASRTAASAVSEVTWSGTVSHPRALRWPVGGQGLEPGRGPVGKMDWVVSSVAAQCWGVSSEAAHPASRGEAGVGTVAEVLDWAPRLVLTA